VSDETPSTEPETAPAAPAAEAFVPRQLDPVTEVYAPPPAQPLPPAPPTPAEPPTSPEPPTLLVPPAEPTTTLMAAPVPFAPFAPAAPAEPVFDEPVVAAPVASVFDEPAAPVVPVFDEPAAPVVSVFDEPAAPVVSVFDEPAAPVVPVFDEPVVAAPVVSVFDEPAAPAVSAYAEPVVAVPAPPPAPVAPVFLEPVVAAPAPPPAPVAPAAPVALAAPVLPEPTPTVPASPPAAPTVPAYAPVAVPAPAPASRKTRRIVTGMVFGVIALILLGAIAWVLYDRFYADPTKNAQAGACLADLPTVDVGEDRAVNSARVVDCTDPTAAYVVEGRLDRVSDDQAKSATVCQAYPDATFIYRQSTGSAGYVLCLRKLDQ
jgi:hypothetical protein